VYLMRISDAWNETNLSCKSGEKTLYFQGKTA